MSLPELEFSALRQTIASRGTTRMILLPVTVIAWVLATITVLIFSDLPVVTLFPLVVLVGGFEAIHALHVGAERIGRYLQVFYENGAPLPRWETAVMAPGPGLPGGGVDPLFSVVFVCATLLNLVPALLLRPMPAEFAVVATLHAALVLRVVRARNAAARQRAVELETFRALRMSEGDRP